MSVSPTSIEKRRRTYRPCPPDYVPPADHHPQSLVCPFCSGFRGYGSCKRCGCAALVAVRPAGISCAHYRLNEDGFCRVCGADCRGIGGNS